MQSKIERYRFTVEPFHVDFTGHLFLGVLGNHLLNAAGRHSHNRGWGIDQLNEVQYTWVLSRLSIELTEMPAQYEHVEVETWVESVMKLFTERNFLIRNADDGHILNYVIPAEEKPCPIAKFGRTVRFSNEPYRAIPTYYSDVDINGHINSVKYIEHILDLFPREQFEHNFIHRFDIAYKTESYLGDTLTFFTEEVPEEGCATASTHVEIRKHVGVAEKPAGEVVVQAKVQFKNT